MEISCDKFKDVLNNMSNLNRKKNDLKPFLWGFRDYFMMRYSRIEDEVKICEIFFFWLILIESVD